MDANKKDVKTKTKQPYSGITALCLGCESPEKGGQGIKPIAGRVSLALSSINAKMARARGLASGRKVRVRQLP